MAGWRYTQGGRVGIYTRMYRGTIPRVYYTYQDTRDTPLIPTRIPGIHPSYPAGPTGVYTQQDPRVYT